MADEESGTAVSEDRIGVPVGIVGAGAMGGAIASALVDGGVCKPSQLYVSDVSTQRLELLRQTLNVNVRDSNLEVARSASVLVLAVKPQVICSVVSGLSGALRRDQLLVSVAAGVCTSTIESFLQPKSRVIRAMPNTPGLIGMGVTALSKGRHATRDDVEVATKLFRPMGDVVEIDEHAMDAVTGLSGSGPAYCYMFIESLAEAGVLNGLSREIALRLACGTVVGAAMMVKETGDHPAILKSKVTSPAGTTAAALSVLERRGFRSAVMDAVTAAVERSKELSGSVGPTIERRQDEFGNRGRVSNDQS